MTNKSELSYPVALADLTDLPAGHKINASSAQCAALAQRFKVSAINALEAELKVWCDSSGIIHLSGTARADLVQQSIVTLEAMDVQVSVPINDSFARSQKTIDRVFTAEMGEDGDNTMDLEGEDPPDLLLGENLDLGEQVAQALSLEIDPYPKELAYASILDAVQAGVVDPGGKIRVSSQENAPMQADDGADGGVDDGADAEKSRPFAVLASLNKDKS